MDHLQKRGSDPKGSRGQGFRDSSEILRPFSPTKLEKNQMIYLGARCIFYDTASGFCKAECLWYSRVYENRID